MRTPLPSWHCNQIPVLSSTAAGALKDKLTFWDDILWKDRESSTLFGITLRIMEGVTKNLNGLLKDSYQQEITLFLSFCLERIYRLFIRLLCLVMFVSPFTSRPASFNWGPWNVFGSLWFLAALLLPLLLLDVAFRWNKVEFWNSLFSDRVNNSFSWNLSKKGNGRGEGCPKHKEHMGTHFSDGSEFGLLGFSFEVAAAICGIHLTSTWIVEIAHS